MKSRWGTYIPGVFAPHPVLNSELVNLPWFLGIAVYAGDEKLDMERSTVSGYCRTLDLESGLLQRELVWTTRTGNRIAVTFNRFISEARSSLCIQQLIIKASANERVTIKCAVDADVRTNGFDRESGAAI